MKSYKLVIFDWDGTLMDSADKIVNCMQIAARMCEQTIPSAHEVKQIIGISLKPAIKKLFAIDDEQLADKLVEAYKVAFIEHDNTPCPLFEGALDLLAQLQDSSIKLAVATGKARRGLDRAWKNTESGGYFITSRCADEAESKPSSDMLLQILDELTISPNEAVMVGDTTFDMQMAQRIGMDRIGVSFGVHESTLLAQFSPIAIVDDLSELIEHVLPSISLATE